MRGLLALFLLAVPAAHADLYRWVDPQSGSVKFSSVPPPPSQPGVEVLPYRGAAAGSPAASAATALELRWRELLDSIARGAAAAPADRTALQQQLHELGTASAELDRLDPAGTGRRRAAAQSALQRLLDAQP